MCLELFSGAGGSSLGYARAGLNIQFSIEKDFAAAQTYAQNHPNTQVWQEPIENVDFSEFKGVDILLGSPPCQPFSVAGKQLADVDNRDMIPEFTRAIRTLRPRAFIMENVAGLSTARYGVYWAQVQREWQTLGYHLHLAILDAADFGVPQRRARLFAVGFKDPRAFEFPQPIHGSRAGLLPFIKSGSVLNTLTDESLEGAIVTYAKNPVLRPSPWAGMLVNGGGRPIELDAPSPTIPASAGGNRTHIVDFGGVLLEYHRHLYAGGAVREGLVEGVRRLTLTESALLQGFSLEYQFLGAKTSQYRQIGNAVPPPLAEAMGNAVRRALEGEEYLEKYDGKTISSSLAHQFQGTLF